MQRQANRADYYSPQTWQQLNPWIEQNGIAPLARAAESISSTANAVANTVIQTVDATTQVGDGQFGYRDQDPQNSWFYDYYRYTPTYYPQRSGDHYTSAIRYFDADGDGVYDARFAYRDSNDDGRYDEYDRYDFSTQSATRANVDAGETVRTNDVAKIDDQYDEYRGPQDARRHRIQGEIAFIKKAQVNGVQNLIVGIEQEQESTLAIDLGPADALDGRRVEVGRSLTVVGAIEMVGQKELVVADSLQVDGETTIEIERSIAMQLSGQIVDVTSTQIDAAEHYLAVVEINGERQLVDLGPTTTYKVKPAPSTEIVLRGIPIRAQDHRIILAEQVRLGNEVFRIQTTQSRFSK